MRPKIQKRLFGEAIPQDDDDVHKTENWNLHLREKAKLLKLKLCTIKTFYITGNGFVTSKLTNRNTFKLKRETN